MTQTVDFFSEKWKLTNKYGFDPVTKKFHEDWFFKRYGFKSGTEFKRYLHNKDRILDAGCGTGRLSNWLAELTNNQIIAVDISESIKEARKNLRHAKNVKCIRADLMNLPFKKNSFDLIICDMVIHHTENPQKVFNELVNCLKPRGELFVYVYKKKGPLRELFDTLLRSLTTRMSFAECYKFSEHITRIGQVLTGISPTLQRWVYWNLFKCFWNKEHGWDYSVITNMDWYHPKYAFRYNVIEISDWVDRNKAKFVRINVGKSGISFRVTKK